MRFGEKNDSVLFLHCLILLGKIAYPCPPKLQRTVLSLLKCSNEIFWLIDHQGLCLVQRIFKKPGFLKWRFRFSLDDKPGPYDDGQDKKKLLFKIFRKIWCVTWQFCGQDKKQICGRHSFDIAQYIPLSHSLILLIISSTQYLSLCMESAYTL